MSPWVLWYNIPSGPSPYASGTRNDLHCWERKATKVAKATKATKSATVYSSDSNVTLLGEILQDARPAFASAPFDLH